MKTNQLKIILFFLAILGAITPISMYSQTTDYVPDEIIVKFKSSSAQQLSVNIANNIALTGINSIDNLNIKHKVKNIDKLYKFKHKNEALAKQIGLDRTFVLKVPAGSNIEDIIAEYANLADVEFAEPNIIHHAVLSPNDNYFNKQWGLKNTGNAESNPNGDLVGTPGMDINMEAAWDLHTGGSSIILAIIDTGVDDGHPEFSGRMVAGYDFVNNDNDPMDDNGHGTACAGIAAANGNNNHGVAGVNWGCKIMGIKVLNASGSGSTNVISNGVTWAVDNGATVLSLSLGGTGFVGGYEDAFNYAFNQGAVIFAARGNNDNTDAFYPASFTNVIGVGGLSPCGGRKNKTTCDGEDWWGSSYSGGQNALDFVTPCTRIYTTDITGSGGYKPGDYMSHFNGTSSACPFAAGVGALLLSFEPGLTPTQVRTRMRNTCKDVGPSGYDDETGFGLVDAYEVLAASVPQVPTADFGVSKTSIWDGESVNFMDQTSGVPTSWSWTFEGGTPSTSTAQNPTVTYNNVGTYNVSLTASNSLGSDTETKTNYITVTVTPNFVSALFENCNYGGYEGKFEEGYFTLDDMVGRGVSSNNVSSIKVDPGYQVTVYQHDNFDGYSWTITSDDACLDNNTNNRGDGSNWDNDIESIIVGTLGSPVPPSADFSANTTTITEGESINFTDLSVHSPTSWSWSFEGGTPSSSTSQNPTVTYNSGGGTYNVTLTVTNSAGNDTETKTGYIRVYSITGPNVYQAEEYTNQSGCTFSTQHSGYTGSGYMEISAFDWLEWNNIRGDGGTATLTFRYANGSAFDSRCDIIVNGTNVTELTFAKTNSWTNWSTVTYDVALNSGNNTINIRKSNASNFNFDKITVEGSGGPVPPVAAFSANNTTVNEGGSVNFTDQSTGSPTSWSWSFEGGTPSGSTSQNPTVTYNNVGTYNVSLTASNSLGSDTETKNNYITVTVAPNFVSSIFQHCDYGGYEGKFEVGDFTLADLNARGVANDDASSIRVDPGYEVTVYQHDNFGGYSWTITSDDPCFDNNTNGRGDGTNWDNDISSIKVAPTGGPSPPVADFSANVTSVNEGGSVNFTDLSSNGPTSWSWSFEGGTPSNSSSQNPTVTYNTAGTYNVSLTATNSAGSDTETKTNYITVTATSVSEYQAENYTSQSGCALSTEHSGYTGSGYMDYGGSGSFIEWNNVSGDGGSTATLTFRYSNGSGSTRNCDLIVNGSTVANLGFTATSTWATWTTIERTGVSINSGNNTIRLQQTSSGGPNLDKMTVTTDGGGGDPPIADFSANVTNITEGESVNFTDNSSNSPTSWSWTFEGGTPSGSSSQNPTVTYNTAGTYNVTLTATNSAGSDTETKTNYITVTAAGNPPIADFSANVTTITEGESVNFTDLSSNSPTSWSWTFEGGSPSGSSSQNPTVTYNTAGTYDVTLTATNSHGSDTETKTNYITVTAAGGDCISSFPYSESFESGLGGFTQNTNDDFDWTRNSGGTPSNNTGPSGAADGSYYLYTEATPNNPNQRAILTSPCFDLTGISNPAFEFQYHMYGADLGTMDVQVSTNGGSSWTTEWSRTGDQGNSWHAASVDLNSYTNSSDVLIRFNTINNGWASDFSIDDVGITVGSAEDIDHTDPPGTGTITARAEIHSGEGKEKAFDNLFASGNFTKWLDNGGIPGTSNPSWIQIQLPAAVVVNKLAIVSANDDFGRDPEDFNLQGSNNGSSWTTLDSWTGQNWANRYERKDFSFSNSTAYSYYRLNITKNDDNVSMTQLCEIMLIGPANKSAVAFTADNLSEQNGISRFRVYPNPAYDVFTIESPGNLITTIELVDIQGRSVYQNTFTDKLNINTSDISEQGILFIKLTTETDSYIEKLIIK